MKVYRVKELLNGHGRCSICGEPAGQDGGLYPDYIEHFTENHGLLRASLLTFYNGWNKQEFAHGSYVKVAQARRWLG